MAGRQAKVRGMTVRLAGKKFYCKDPRRIGCRFSTTNLSAMRRHDRNRCMTNS